MPTNRELLLSLRRGFEETEEMEARYLTNESGERIGVVLDVAEYERLRRSAEEAARAERRPGIAFRGTEGSRRAWVPGTALDVWEIVAGHEEMGRQRFLEQTGISEDRLDAALAYHRGTRMRWTRRSKTTHARCNTGESATRT
jgi:hypothetical protein